MDTASGAIPLKFGEQLSLGVYANDTDGSFITKESFVAYVNGDVDPMLPFRAPVHFIKFFGHLMIEVIIL